MNSIRKSITAKICVSILLVETLLLSLMGVYYVQRFWQEIDEGVAQKMAQPGILMANRALNFDAVADLSVLEEILQENVSDAFITKVDGRVYYSHDQTRIGQDYTQYIDSNEQINLSDSLQENRYFSFTSDTGQNYRSIISPLKVKDRLIGILYIKIDSERIQNKKNDILFLFLFGSIATILFTTLLEALIVHRIFVPPIHAILAALKKVEAGDMSTRIDQSGLSDQLGILVEQVNSMIITIERNIKGLVLLNYAGDVMNQAETEKDVKWLAKEIVEEFVLQSAGSADTGQVALPELDFSLSGSDFVDRVITIVSDIRAPFSSSGAEEFAQALAELINSTMKRIKGLEEVKEAEEKYRALFTTALEGIFRTSPDGKVLDANPAVAKMAGYDSPEEMIRLCDDLASQHYVDPAERQVIVDEINLHGKVTDAEFRLRRKDGSEFWASMSAHKVEDSEGRFTVIEGRLVDITERKQKEKAELEQQVAEASEREKTALLEVLENKNKELRNTLDELKSTQMKLVQSEKMGAIGLTVGGVAHDLNNILSGVISYPEMILMKLPEDSKYRKPLESIMASGRRAAAVVDDMLTLTRGVMKNKVAASLNSMVNDYLHSAEFNQLVSGKPDVVISIDLQAASPNIDCSPVHIQKVIMNLVTNAIEAVGSAGTVRISTQDSFVGAEGVIVPDLAPGQYVQMRVEDDGPGIRKKDVHHIFEPFYTKKVMGRSGTGLGLAIVQTAVEEHGGTVRVKSTGNCTIFDVYLPAGNGSVEIQDDSQAIEELEGSGTILVVDDEPLQRDVARKMLLHLGYAVLVVESGEKALDYLSKESADLLLLDMLMPPGMNGYETYREIVRTKPDQKAILVSGYSEHEDVSKALELGVGQFVKKPYSIRTLGRAVQVELAK